ncbi:uncharacterized protein LOC134226282 [Armigeres subalbatus]|uniref:uncharacterized protein LOC134226282 n=1 Tax=Armigeres subalbatus TaxID=124917 RepID=UPI002ED44924
MFKARPIYEDEPEKGVEAEEQEEDTEQEEQDIKQENEDTKQEKEAKQTLENEQEDDDDTKIKEEEEHLLQKLWQLKMKKKRKSNQQQYNILLFGETGSGKSTLVNYLTNYFRGGSLKKLKIAIPTKYHEATEGCKYSEQDLQDTTTSKTRDCIDYEFTKSNDCFNFIDTPGLSDTEGTTKDDEHIMKIMTAAENRGTLSAIVIVINGTVARATVNLRNTLTLLKGSVPDVLLKNLLVVLTNCTKATANFELKQLEPWVVPKDNVFYMNNSALCMPVEQWKDDDELREDVEAHWKKSMRAMEALTKKIRQLGYKVTHAFKDMRLKRNKIKAELHGILLEVKKLQKMQDELNCAQSAEKDVASDIQKYSNFKQTKQVDYTELEDADYHSTICMTHSKVCHEKCGLNYTQTQGAEIFKGCSCMSGSRCGQCECPHSTHYHDRKKPVKKSKTVDDILHDVKALYDQHSNKKIVLRRKISNLNSDIGSLKRALDSKEGDIKKCCEELKTLCSQFNFVDELQSIIDTMERDARTLTNMAARQDADKRINNFVHLANELSESK